MKPHRPRKISKKKTKKRSHSSDLFAQVIQMTGIPARTIKKELKGILERKDIDANNLTLEQLRCVVASYLREIMGSLLDKCNPKRTESH